MTPRESTGFASPRRCPSYRGRSESGVVLPIALIVLVALMLASISLVRSVDTANMIAGNLAFKQGTVQAGDLGIEIAAAALPAIAVNTDSLAPQNSAQKYWYYATRRETDTNGVPMATAAGEGSPAAINWDNVPIGVVAAGNTVKVVIDRLCRAPTPTVDDIRLNCFYEGDPDGSFDNHKPSIQSVPVVYYRVTTQVTGPRNAQSTVQAILGR